MTLKDYMYQDKKKREDLPGGRQRLSIDTTIGRLHRKAQRRTDYSLQKRYGQHDKQRNDNNKNNWEEKQLYRRFKRIIINISLGKSWKLFRKGNLKRET